MGTFEINEPAINFSDVPEDLAAHILADVGGGDYKHVMHLGLTLIGVLALADIVKLSGMDKVPPALIPMVVDGLGYKADTCPMCLDCVNKDGGIEITVPAGESEFATITNSEAMARKVSSTVESRYSVLITSSKVELYIRVDVQATEVKKVKSIMCKATSVELNCDITGILATVKELSVVERKNFDSGCLKRFWAVGDKIQQMMFNADPKKFSKAMIKYVLTEEGPTGVSPAIKRSILNDFANSLPNLGSLKDWDSYNS